jgi:hypothetical protein
MKGLLGSMAVLWLLVAAEAFPADPLKEPAYSSEKPLYARIELDEKGSKVLTLALDESKGTGKGYDTMYPDLNLNGDLTDDEPTRGLLGEGSGSASYVFPPLSGRVEHGEEGEGSDLLWELTLSYDQYQRKRLWGLIKGDIQRRFFLQVMTRRKEGRAEWEYLFYRLRHPAQSLSEADADVVSFCGKADLQVVTTPDRRKQGNTGIAAYVMMCGDRVPHCKRDSKSVIAKVEVKNADGKTVHSDNVNLDKLVFG